MNKSHFNGHTYTAYIFNVKCVSRLALSLQVPASRTCVWHPCSNWSTPYRLVYHASYFISAEFIKPDKQQHYADFHMWSNCKQLLSTKITKATKKGRQPRVSCSLKPSPQQQDGFKQGCTLLYGSPDTRTRLRLDFQIKGTVHTKNKPMR